VPAPAPAPPPPPATYKEILDYGAIGFDNVENWTL
jgi:hypothetical protein